ncbi:hypothetical protein WOLCODRAFT_164295 [Wolfiporia cocos MD-104 SS10]|uniref:Uncharacterized protein n=1 Tax=Wolfiporia cocos (strain MD-104) TaxID=742152 RepID=A0A2H3K2A4_WOLCO|nr:hypothetical protein WOLCODRAFT_164295 [Wolfiporia cocos MD-104 SS10]
MSNFIAHAATVPTVAGRPWYINLRWTAIVLFLPFAGLWQSMILLSQHIMFSRDNLHQALSRGALLMVCRDNDWEPPSDREDRVFVQLPKGFHETSDKHAMQSWAKFKIMHVCHEKIDVSAYNVHGDMLVPRGYSFAKVHKFPLTDILVSTLANTGSMKLARHRSWAKMAVSGAQLMFAFYTLYRARGDQISHYGYAAYGLSVFPYAFMTLINLIAVGVVGDYPCLYVVRSSILREAGLRVGSRFDGAIGVLKDEDKTNAGESEGALGAPASQDFDTKTMLDPDLDTASVESKTFTVSLPELESGSHDEPPLTEAWLRLETLSCGGQPAKRLLVVRAGEWERRFLFASPGQDLTGRDVYEFGIGGITNEDVHYSLGRSEESIIRNYCGGILFYLSFVMAYLMPYMVIYALTGFRREHSTVAQRAWTMGWLCSSQLAFYPLNASILTHTGGLGITLGSFRSNPRFWFTMAILMVAPIGGYVTVSQMYLSSDFTSTTLCL